MDEKKGVLVGTAKLRKATKGYMVKLSDAWCNDEYVRIGDSVEQRREGEYLILRHIKRDRP